MPKVKMAQCLGIWLRSLRRSDEWEESASFPADLYDSESGGLKDF